MSGAVHGQPRGFHEQNLLGVQYLLRSPEPASLAGRPRTEGTDRVLPVGADDPTHASRLLLHALYALEVGSRFTGKLSRSLRKTGYIFQAVSLSLFLKQDLVLTNVVTICDVTKYNSGL